MDSKRLLKTFSRDLSQKNKIVETVDYYLKEIEPLSSYKKIREIPFSSDRKFSACIYPDQTLILGAPEALLKDDSASFKQVRNYMRQALRVVVFGQVAGQLDKDHGKIEKYFRLLSIVVIDDPVREEAFGTLEKLAKEQIGFKIISGDAPETVLAVAQRINPNFEVKITTGDKLEKLESEEFEKVILEHNVFARINPHQKQSIIKVYKKNHLFTVMVGDGVNDILAIKESDLGIAMNAGSQMAKDVADVVLLNNSFSTLPLLLNQGRRIITNIQSIANIYLIKNISAITAILILGFIGLRFPFDPRHVEVASLLIIGVPSLVLALDKHNFSIYAEGFVKRLLLFSGIVGFINSLVFTIVYTYFDLTSNMLFYSQTMLLTTVIFLGVNNLVLIYLQHYSLSQILRRKIMTRLISGIYAFFGLVLVIPFLKQFFGILDVNISDLFVSFLVSLLGSMLAVLVLKRFGLISNQNGS